MNEQVHEYIEIVDHACKAASADTLVEMKKHFMMSCKLEHMFWDQAQERMEWPEILTRAA